MIPRMTALLAFLAVLLSGPAFGAESLGSVPQVVDADISADKPSLYPTPDQDKNSMAAAVEVEIQRRFNELRRESLDNRRKFLDKRAKDVDWWLVAVSLFLSATTLFLAVIAIVATVASIFTFRRFREIETEARQNVAVSKEHAEAAKRFVEEIEGHRDQAEAYKDELKELNAEAASQKPDEAARTVASVQGDPVASPTARAIAAAVRLQQQRKIEEAIEKWRSIANVAGEEDRQLQARAWFSIGYLREEGDDLEAVIDAYTTAIQMNPDLAAAYTNRGAAKARLSQYAAAVADFDQAIRLEPDNATAYNNRGEVKETIGQYQAALADFDRAIELDPARAEAYHHRAITKKNLGHINEAREDCQKALALAQAAGNEDLVTTVQSTLRQLDNNEEP